MKSRSHFSGDFRIAFSNVQHGKFLNLLLISTVALETRGGVVGHLGFLQLLLLLDLWQRFNGSVGAAELSGMVSGVAHNVTRVSHFNIFSPVLHSFPKVSSIGTAKKHSLVTGFLFLFLSSFLASLGYFPRSALGRSLYTPLLLRPEFADQLEMRDAAFTGRFGQNGRQNAFHIATRSSAGDSLVLVD